MSGYAGSLEAISTELHKHNIDIGQLTGIIISHDDIDHVGGLHEIKAINPSAKVYASKIEAPYISGQSKSLRLKQEEDLFDLLPPENKEWGKQFQNELKAIKRVPVDETFEFDTAFKKISKL